MKRAVTFPLFTSLFLLCAVIWAQAAFAQEMPITTDSEEARAAFMEGMKLSENLRAAEARAHYDEAIAADPDFALAHLFRALSSDSGPEFLKHLEHAADRADNASEGERLMIQSWQAQADGKSDRRRELLKQLAEKYPEDKQVAFSYATVQEEPAQRARMLEEVTEMAPSYAPAYNSLGYAYRTMGEYEKAEEAFKQYVDLIPEEPNPYDSMADLYMKMGRFEDAIAQYEKALERSPKFTISQSKIGLSHDLMGRHEEARGAYAKRAEMEETPNGKIDARVDMARSYLHEGNYEEALSKTDEAIRMAEESGLPRAAWLKMQKAWFALHYGKLGEAEQYLSEAKAYANEHTLPEPFQNEFQNVMLWNEALLTAKQGNHESAHAKAKAFKEERVDRQIGSADADWHHDLMGHLYLSEGDYEKAAAHFRQSDQEDPYVLYHLALAEDELGNEKKAAELMKKVADWNEEDMNYALVRPEAQEWMRQRQDT